MERKDLLTENGKIFKKHAENLDKFAKETCKVLVVGNPANTNANILAHFCKRIPKENITALTRLD
jgi:malate dehydrogenase